MHHLIFSASALLGTDLITRDKVSIGTLEDIVCNKENGQITYLVVSAGGYLGHQDQLYAIHHSFFFLNGDDEALIFDVDRGDKSSDRVPNLPEHYEGTIVLSFGDFSRNILPHLTLAEHRSDNEAI